MSEREREASAHDVALCSMKGRLERSLRNNKGLRAKNASLGVQLKEKEALNNKLLLFLSSALTKIDDLKGIALLLL